SLRYGAPPGTCPAATKIVGPGLNGGGTPPDVPRMLPGTWLSASRAMSRNGHGPGSRSDRPGPALSDRPGPALSDRAGPGLEWARAGPAGGPGTGGQARGGDQGPGAGHRR